MSRPNLYRSSWLVCFRPKPAARVRVLAIHHAGGGASAFRNWAADLGDEIELWAVRLPGRESRIREMPYRRMHDLIPTLLADVGALWDQHSVLFGHSMGAWIVFELARQARLDGLCSPAALVVAGCRSPQSPRRDPLMSHLSDESLTEVLRGSGIVPLEVLENRELLNLILPTLRADFALCEDYRYTPGPRLDCAILGMGGVDDPGVSPSELDAWSDLTTARYDRVLFPGGHFFPFTHREAVTRQLTEAIRSLKIVK